MANLAILLLAVILILGLGSAGIRGYLYAIAPWVGPMDAPMPHGLLLPFLLGLFACLILGLLAGYCAWIIVARLLFVRSRIESWIRSGGRVPYLTDMSLRLLARLY